MKLPLSVPSIAIFLAGINFNHALMQGPPEFHIDWLRQGVDASRARLSLYSEFFLEKTKRRMACKIMLISTETE